VFIDDYFPDSNRCCRAARTARAPNLPLKGCVPECRPRQRVLARQKARTRWTVAGSACNAVIDSAVVTFSCYCVLTFKAQREEIESTTSSVVTRALA
jgi:hypothetical protein